MEDSWIIITWCFILLIQASVTGEDFICVLHKGCYAFQSGGQLTMLTCWYGLSRIFHTTFPLLCMHTKHASDLGFVQVDFLSWKPYLMTSWHRYWGTFPVMLLNFILINWHFFGFYSFSVTNAWVTTDQTQGDCTELQILREGWKDLSVYFLRLWSGSVWRRKPGCKLIWDFRPSTLK